MDDKLDILTSIVRQDDRAPIEHASHGFHDSEPTPSGQRTDHPTTSHTGEPASFYASPSHFLDTSRILEELSLSQRHSTAPQHLLSWPCCSLQMSEVELQYPTNLEIKRQKLSLSGLSVTSPQLHSGGEIWTSRLSLSQVSLPMIQCYFEHFHPSCLVLDKAKFYSQILPQALQTNFAKNDNTCVTLFVCALGSIAAYYCGHKEWFSDLEHDVGIELFALASDMFSGLEGPTWTSVQCLLLMGSVGSFRLCCSLLARH